jgi:hypothetical protein
MGDGTDPRLLVVTREQALASHAAMAGSEPDDRTVALVRRGYAQALPVSVLESRIARALEWSNLGLHPDESPQDAARRQALIAVTVLFGGGE